MAIVDHPPAKYLCLLLGTFAFFLLSNAPYARCASATFACGYLCVFTYASNLCPLRIRQQSTFACCWRLQRKGNRGGTSSKCISTAEGKRGGQSATQLMPAAQQQRSVRGRYGHKGNRGGKRSQGLLLRRTIAVLVV
jgi:hypothetical protein